nr:hypothetical protein [Hassalia byssoidea]
MTVEIKLIHCDRPNKKCLDYRKIIAQFTAVIAPTTKPAANFG